MPTRAGGEVTLPDALRFRSPLRTTQADLGNSSAWRLNVACYDSRDSGKLSRIVPLLGSQMCVVADHSKEGGDCGYAATVEAVTPGRAGKHGFWG